MQEAQRRKEEEEQALRKEAEVWGRVGWWVDTCARCQGAQTCGAQALQQGASCCCFAKDQRAAAGLAEALNCCQRLAHCLPLQEAEARRKEEERALRAEQRQEEEERLRLLALEQERKISGTLLHFLPVLLAMAGDAGGRGPAAVCMCRDCVPCLRSLSPLAFHSSCPAPHCCLPLQG